MSLGWIFALAQLTSGPSSEPGAKKRAGFPFLSFGCLFQFIFIPPSLCFRQIIPCFPQDSVQPSGKSVGVFPLRRISQGAPPFVGPLPPLELVGSCSGSGNLAHLRFFDSGHFRASNIHIKLSLWQDFLEKSPCSKVELKVIRNGVRVFRFFKPFRGNFKGQAYSGGYSYLKPGRQCSNPTISSTP